MNAGKNVLLDRMHSKFLGHHLYQQLNEKGQKYLKLESREYTYTSTDGCDTGHNGLSVLVLILSRIKPQYMVNLHKEVEKCKSLTLGQ